MSFTDHFDIYQPRAIPELDRIRCADALDLCRQQADYLRLVCPDLSEMMEVAHSLICRFLMHLEIEAGLASYRDLAPELTLPNQDCQNRDPSAAALRIARLELQSIETAARLGSDEATKAIGNVCYCLARLVSGGELQTDDTQRAIMTAATNCGVFTLIDRETFNTIVRRNWRNGLAKPRTLKTEKRAAQ